MADQTTRITVDGDSLALKGGAEGAAPASLLVELLRADLHPTRGGCLCLAGDCNHCLASVDGVSYVRTCQVEPKPGMVVCRDHLDGSCPPLLSENRSDSERDPAAPSASGAVNGQSTVHQHRHCDVVVIGQGRSGVAEADRLRATGKEVIALDARSGQEVAGIYAGPMVLARIDPSRQTGSGVNETLEQGIVCVFPREEVVVATGAAELQPVAPGAELQGLVTARAASELAEAGVELGHVVALGEPPKGVDAECVLGQLVRFEGQVVAGDDAPDDGVSQSRRRVSAVVVRPRSGDQNGDQEERRYPCDTVSLGLGFHPRDALFRMGRELPVRMVGSVSRPADLPPCPSSGTVCPCSAVKVEDLEEVWRNGYREMELVKRATLAGTGTCQGAACLPHLRAFLLAKGKQLQPPFTARPLTRQLTMAELAAGAHHQAAARTPLHHEHLRLGARMERAGGWWRPWDYGDVERERRGVRQGVSLGDVSTLGKFLVRGPDALQFLEWLYPTKVASLRPGKSRYALMLDERGYVLDDGLICREVPPFDSEEPTHPSYYLTLTSGGASFGELWLRDWAESLELDVYVLNQTHSLAAINVTGPHSAELLVRAGANHLPAFASHCAASIAGVDCRVLRLSFTGELSYELHVAAADAVRLWRALLEFGQDLGVGPHGLDALFGLRLEKGHIVVGQDTDYDSTPRRIQHEWALALDHTDFVGKQAVLRTNQEPVDRRLVGLRGGEPAPVEGAPVWHGDQYAGYVTSSTQSAALDGAVMLAWVQLFDGELPDHVTVGRPGSGQQATVVEPGGYDPDGSRARVKVSVESVRDALSVPGVSREAQPNGQPTEQPTEQPSPQPDEERNSGRTAKPGQIDPEPPIERSMASTESAEQAGQFQATQFQPAEFQPIEAVRVVASQRALAELDQRSPKDCVVLPLAPDERLIVPRALQQNDASYRSQRSERTALTELAGLTELTELDPGAIVQRETGFVGLWMDPAQATAMLQRHCSWQPPSARPALAQGAVAEIPTKLWFEQESVLVIVSRSLAEVFARRAL